jgi:hypothetical protein
MTVRFQQMQCRGKGSSLRQLSVCLAAVPADRRPVRHLVPVAAVAVRGLGLVQEGDVVGDHLEPGRGTARQTVADSCFSPAWFSGLAVRRPIRATLFTVFLLENGPEWTGFVGAREHPPPAEAARGGTAERRIGTEPWRNGGSQRPLGSFGVPGETSGFVGVKRPLRRERTGRT